MVEDLIQRYILSIGSPQDDTEEILEEISQEFSNKSLTFSDFIKLLQEYLISEEPSLRSKGLSLFSDLLDKINGELITKNEVQAFTQFFIERLADKYCITEVLKGISNLQKVDSKFTYEEAYKVLDSLFKNITVQELNQGLRLQCFHIIAKGIKDFPKIPNEMKDDFFKGFIEAVDGEKDPRNLMVVFGLVKHVIINYNIIDFSQDFFDITFCYFPITFKAPKDDPFSVSPLLLKEELREILSSTYYFDEYAIPAILQKVSSSSPNAKKDSLNLLISALPVYRVNQILSNLQEIVGNLIEEIFHPIDEDIQNLAFKVTKVLFSKLSTEDVNYMKNPSVQDAVNSLLTEIKTNFSSDDVKNIKAAGLCLRSICESHFDLCFELSKTLFLLLLDLYNKVDLVTQRKALIENIVHLLCSYEYILLDSKFSPNISLSNNDAIFYVKDTLMIEFSKALSQPGEFIEIQKLSIKGLSESILIPNLLTLEEKKHYTQAIVSFLLTVDDGLVRNEVLSYLYKVGKKLPEIISEVVLPMIFSQLPRDKNDFASITNTQYNSSLDSFVKLSFEASTFILIKDKLFSLIDLIGKEENPGYSIYLTKLLQVLFDILNEESNLFFKNDPTFLINNVVTQLVYKSISFCLSTLNSIICLPENIDLISHIIISTVRKLDSKVQEQILNESYKLFFSKDDKGLFFGNQTTNEFINFNPFIDHSSLSQSNVTKLYNSFLIASRKEAFNFPISIETFLSSLLELALNTNNGVVFHSCCQTISIIVNKKFKDNMLNEFIEQNFLGELQSGLSNISNQTHKRKVSLELITWVCKALIIQGDNLGFKLLEALCNFLDDVEVGIEIAGAIDNIFKEDIWLFSKENFFIIKLLYKQRSFSILLPKLTKGFLDAKVEGSKQNFLIAISSLLAHIPKQILLRDGATLLPLLLSALDHFVPQIQASALKTLTVILEESSGLIMNVYPNLLSKLLLLLLPNSPSNGNKYIPLQVRIEAVKCLGLFPRYLPVDLLLPSQFEVSQALLPALDDPKRVVRSEAVRCRNRWLSFSNKA